MKQKSIKLNAFLNSLKNILSLIFPLITFPYISRTLSIQSMGIYNFSNSINSYFLLIAALGIGTYAIREGAKYRDDINKMSEFASQIFTINLLSTLVSYILLIISVFVFKKLEADRSCILLFSLQIIFMTIGTDWLYSIYEDYIFTTLRGIAFNFISLFLLFIFVRGENDYLQYTAITVFATAGSNILNFIHARSFCQIKITRRINLMKHILPILIIFASNAAITIYVGSDITLLGILKNNYSVGIYSVATKVYSIANSVLSAVMIVTIPRFSFYYGKKLFEKFNQLFRNVLNILLMLSLPAMVGLFMLSKKVILLLSGQKYISSTSSLRILCFAIILSLGASILTNCVLIPARREKYVLISTIISGIINISLNLLLIPIWSEKAAAFSTVLAELFALCTSLYFSKDLVRKEIFSNYSLKNLLTSLIGCILIVVICSAINIKNLFLSLVISIITSVVTYFLTLIVLKNPIMIDFYKKHRVF